MKNVLRHFTFIEDNDLSMLLSVIFEQGPITKTDLEQKISLERDIIPLLIEKAMREDLVITIEQAEDVDTYYKINPNYGYSLGVDLSRNPARCALMNFNGEVVIVEKLDGFIGREALSIQLPQAINEFIERQDIEPDKIKWVGLGIPGDLDIERETIVYSYFLQVSEFPLYEIMHEALNKPVYLVNDLEAAACAERLVEADEAKQTFAYILIDYGVGACLILENQLYRGAQGNVGNIFQLGGYGTEHLYSDLIKEYPSIFAHLSPDEALGKFFEKGLTGTHPKLKEKLDDMVNHIATYFGGLLQFLDLEKIFLSGWPTSNAILFQRLCNQIQLKEYSRTEPTLIRAPHWESNGTAVGAAKLGLYKAFNQRILA